MWSWFFADHLKYGNDSNGNNIDYDDDDGSSLDDNNNDNNKYFYNNFMLMFSIGR